ncbi:galactose oxidase-like domain-containing protein [Spongiimicrobium sp. 2-473A-2-J]|uniref:galactose oxidase-like domain-containing protein n=1 Tax=Eudoraea algarum TaxID=3417568 RepID=UPI003D360F96
MSAANGVWEAPQVFKVPDQTRYDRSGANMVVDKRGLFVLHSFLLRTGKVLVFCGHVESADFGGNPTGAVTSDYRGVSYVFDPNNPGATMTPKYFPTGLDLFCCHYVQIPDGRILVVGGSLDFHAHGSVGAKNICYFDPTTEQWTLSKTGSSTNEMDQGRWYPTAVLLPTGNVVVFSGRNAGIPEINSAGEPVFRDFRTGDPAAVPMVAGVPQYVDAGGNSLPLNLFEVRSPTGVLRFRVPAHISAPGAEPHVMVTDISTPRNFFFFLESTLQVFTATVAGGVPTFTLDPTPIANLTALRQRGYDISDKVELLSAPNYSAREVTGATFRLPIYPGMHLSPNGKIFFTGSNWGQEIDNPNTRALSVNEAAVSGSWDTFGGGLRPNQPNREEGMSVLLPPARDGKILLFGGSLALNASGGPIMQTSGNVGFNRINSATDPKSAEILDTLASPPTWTPTTNTLAHGRINGHGVILPDETVLIAGGHDNFKWLNTGAGTTPSRICEIFDGTTFRPVAALTHPRMYHSTALLLPDGKVMVSGGADPNDLEPALHQNPNGTPKRFTPPFTNAAGQEQPYPQSWNGPTYGVIDALGNYTSMALNRKDYEIYQPPYFFKGPRPVITDVLRNGSSTGQVFYDQQFDITSPDAANITKVAFIRPGGPTHHTDTEQRYVQLDFTLVSGKLRVTVPNNRNLAPPGYYMLWIMKDAAPPLTGLVPCDRAKFIQLAEPPPAPVPTSTNDDDCIIATTTLGSANHEMVLYLQLLRRELKAASAFGNRFIHTVNRVYYSFSPALARIIAKDERAKATVRMLVVLPTVYVIKHTERLVNLLVPPSKEKTTLMVLLLIDSLLGVVLLPLLLVLTLYSILRQNLIKIMRG